MTSINSDAVRILKRLRERGHQAFLVGGCVRDLLMGHKPKDWDVATDARPEEVMALFAKTIPVGEKFGVVIVRRRHRNFEVATFREEWGYSDGRRPDGVRFSTAKADASRRDFTINGLFYDPVTKKIIDHVGGQKDLARGVIRAIGDPEARFNEDKLRMMRAVRFAARFDFKIAARTARAIREHAAEIVEVSRERVRDELMHVLQEDRPVRGLRLMDELGLLAEVLPEVAAMKGVKQPPEFHPEGDVFEHTLIMLGLMRRRFRARPEFALAVMLHDVGKPPTYEELDRIRFNNHMSVGAEMSGKILRRLRFSRDAITIVAELIADHLRFKDVMKMRPATLKRFLRREHFDLHLELHRLDCLASHGDLSNHRFCRQKLRELGQEPQKLRPPRLVTGDDLIKMGLPPGPAFREILSALEDAQLEGKARDRAEALEWVKNYIAAAGKD
ncbi:MAG TPA: CCA tRNA nucleotidyltransferase [bacterium]|nr:CCA tRNA nucleotidyltransferase [bacterium]